VTDRLTPDALRAHADAQRSVTWESAARQLLRWAADCLEAAERMTIERQNGKP
jgi:hypothetical protein